MHKCAYIMFVSADKKKGSLYFIFNNFRLKLYLFFCFNKIAEKRKFSDGKSESFSVRKCSFLM